MRLFFFIIVPAALLGGCSLAAPSWSLTISPISHIEISCANSVLKEIISSSDIKKHESEGFGLIPYWGKIKTVILNGNLLSLGKNLNFNFYIILDEKVREKVSDLRVGVTVLKKSGIGHINDENIKELNKLGPSAIDIVKTIISKMEKECELNFEPANKRQECSAEFCEINGSK